MNKSPSFQFYAQDFLTGVMYLTNEEIGIYIKMLAKQWTDERIPKKRLGFLVGYDWDNLSAELRSKFNDLGDYVINERLEKERQKKNNFLKKQAENGRKGGRPLKNKKPKRNPNDSQKKPLEEEIEIEEEKEVELEVRKRSKKFLKPKITELQICFQESGLNPDIAFEQSELFFNHYESNGWKVGKNPMKSWKAAVGNWVRRIGDFKTKKNNGNKQTRSEINENHYGGIAAALEADLKSQGL